MKEKDDFELSGNVKRWRTSQKVNSAEKKFGLIKTRMTWGGTQLIFRLENGYGASVISNIFSYGGDKGLWELAVIKFFKNGEWDLVYDTDITDDVIGYLTWKDVEALLEDIKNLNKNGKFSKKYKRKYNEAN